MLGCSPVRKVAGPAVQAVETVARQGGGDTAPVGGGGQRSGVVGSREILGSNGDRVC